MDERMNVHKSFNSALKNLEYLFTVYMLTDQYILRFMSWQLLRFQLTVKTKNTNSAIQLFVVVFLAFSIYFRLFQLSQNFDFW